MPTVDLYTALPELPRQVTLFALLSDHSFIRMTSPAKRVTSRNSSTDKRAAILRAATRVFARNGYFNSKVADIARAAGVADGTVYLYFKSKEEILHSLFDRSVGSAIHEVRKQIASI